MATKQLNKIPAQLTRSYVNRWVEMASGDDGSPCADEPYSERCVQVTGKFGIGGAVVIEGSNDDGVTYSTLTDIHGNPLSFTSPGIKTVAESTQYLRPRVTSGDDGTSLNVHLFAKGG